MKILQIASDYYDTTVYNDLFNELESRLDLKIVVPLTMDKRQSIEAKTFPSNVSPIFCGMPRAFGIQINSSKHARYITRNQYLHGVSLVHAHYVLIDGSIALKLHRKTGVPYVVSVRATCIMNFERKIALHNYINSLNVLKNAKAIFFQTSNALNNLLSKIPKSYRDEVIKKSIISPNGINKFWHENKNAKSKIFNEGEFILLTVASIEHNKNLLATAKAIENLNSRGLTIKYNVAGKIIDQVILVNLMQNSYFKYLGVLDKFELLTAYRQADICIMVSFNETFGLVYAEAMSQGLPVIYSKGQGFDGQFEEGVVGFHADSSSVQDIEEAIMKIANSYKVLANNTLECVDKFNWERIVELYFTRYSEVLENVSSSD
jgi:glycosyltransferase involved in cell wall biosynthesis